MNSRLVQGWQGRAAVAAADTTAGRDLLLVALREAATPTSIVALRVDAAPDAISGPTSQVLWSVELPGDDMHNLESYKFRSTTSVVVGADYGYLVAGSARVLVDLATGTVIAETRSAAPPSGRAALISGNLFVPEGRGLAVYDGATLESLWRKPSPEGLWVQRVSPSGDICALRSLTADSNGERAALWHLAREEVWHLDGPGGLIVGGLLRIDNAVLVATTAFGPCADRIRALDATSGRTIWDTSLPGVEPDRYGPQAYQPSETMMLLGTDISIMSDGASVVIVDPFNGRVSWSVALTKGPTVQAAIGERLWVGTEDGGIALVDCEARAVVDDYSAALPALLPQWPVAILPTSAGTAIVLGQLGALSVVNES